MSERAKCNECGKELPVSQSQYLMFCNDCATPEELIKMAKERGREAKRRRKLQ